MGNRTTTEGSTPSSDFAPSVQPSPVVTPTSFPHLSCVPFQPPDPSSTHLCCVGDFKTLNCYSLSAEPDEFFQPSLTIPCSKTNLRATQLATFSLEGRPRSTSGPFVACSTLEGRPDIRVVDFASGALDECFVFRGTPESQACHTGRICGLDVFVRSDFCDALGSVSLLCSAGYDNRVLGWDIRTGDVRVKFRGPYANDLKAVIEWGQVFVAGFDGFEYQINRYDLGKGIPLSKMGKHHQEQIRAVDCDVVNGVVWCASSDSFASLWDVRSSSGRPIATLGLESEGYSVLTVPERGFALVGGNNGSVEYWDIRKLQKIHSVACQRQLTVYRIARVNVDLFAAASAASVQLLTGEGRAAEHRSLPSSVHGLTLVRGCRGQEKAVESSFIPAVPGLYSDAGMSGKSPWPAEVPVSHPFVDPRPSLDFFCVGGDSKFLGFHSLEDDTLLQSLWGIQTRSKNSGVVEVPIGVVDGLTGPFVATGSNGAPFDIRLYNVSTKTEARSYVGGHEGRISGLGTLTGSGGSFPSIVSGAYDNNLNIWDVESCQLRSRLTGPHCNDLKCVEEWNQVIVVGFEGFDYDVCCFDVARGVSTAKLKGHKDQIHSVDVGLDRGFLLTCSNDMTAKIWDARTRKCVQTLELESQGGAVLTAVDKNFILVGCSDGSIVFYDLRTWQKLIACQTSDRVLCLARVKSDRFASCHCANLRVLTDRGVLESEGEIPMGFARGMAIVRAPT